MAVLDDLKRHAERLGYTPADPGLDNCNKRGALCWWARQQGLGFKEIAEVLGCSTSGAHRLYHVFDAVVSPEAGPARALREYRDVVRARTAGVRAVQTDARQREKAASVRNLSNLALEIGRDGQKLAALSYWGVYRLGMSKVAVSAALGIPIAVVGVHAARVRDAIRMQRASLASGAATWVVRDLAEQLV